MKGSLVLFVALLALVAHSCKELPTQTEPPVALALSLIDSTCTDLELKLSAQPRAQRIVVERLAQPQPVIIFDAVLNTPDTMILDTGLLPNTTYTYRAYRLANNTKRDTSRALHARTMDTTSHNWTWLIENFGDFASSSLCDVAIINDSLAYAVGKIYLQDSLGQNDPVPYSVGIWNGRSWSFKKMLYNGTQPLVNIRGVWVASSSEIWLAAGSVFLWDGCSSQTTLVFSRLTLPNPNATIEKIWGSARNNLYGVGNAGTIIHYDGTSWRRIESGTDLNLYDIYGDGGEILVIGSSFTPQRQEQKLLKINPIALTVSSVNSQGINPDVTTVWFISARKYLVGGDGLFYSRSLNTNKPWYKYPNGQITNNYTTAIGGNRINDFMVAGTFMDLIHFNGVSWKKFGSQLPSGAGVFVGVQTKNSLSIATGQLNHRAIIAVGRR
jgi:hypothetical protein